MLFLFFQKCLCCKRFKRKKMLHQVASDRIESQLDVARLIKNQMLFKVVFGVLFTKV